MLTERLLILLFAALLLLGLWALWRLALAVRMRRLAAQPVPPALSRLVVPGRPQILYFTTETCAQCRFQQSPILTQLAAMTAIPVHAIDAVAQPELADYYGILTVPTTVFLDARLRPVAINHGLTSLQQLQEQATHALSAA
ncbi:MAG: hypothetical protein KatS3mg050_3901 [Litorilinea sp.]|nr:MAG: hypothetical protein KatS3mg050_3901 [Litorilinea sp.]